MLRKLRATVKFEETEKEEMIAAITINNEAKLYTFDLKHFSSLKAFGLKLFP